MWVTHTHCQVPQLRLHTQPLLLLLLLLGWSVVRAL
jgi:hypothetical protein